MDTLISAGTHGVDGRGLPVQIDGVRELVQRAMIRLSVRKGSFLRDPGLGSELFRLAHQNPAARDRIALSYAQEALAPIREIRVESAACREQIPDTLLVRIGLVAGGKTYTLEVPQYG